MIRDEIAKALAASNYWLSQPEIRDATDALLPIVERVVREAAWEGANEHATNGRTTMSAIDAIVARVMESE